MAYASPAMIPRLFAPLDLSQDAVVPLDGAASHHAIRVLRLGPGAVVELFDGRGQAADAIIVSTSPATVRIGQLHPPAGPAALHLTLAQCISAADKMDWTIEKAVELGVAAIVPLQSHKAIVKLSAERAARRHEHWQRLVVAASAQSRQNRVPGLLPAIKLEDWLRRGDHERLRTAMPTGETVLDGAATAHAEAAPLRLVLDPRAAQSLPAVMAAQGATAAGNASAEAPSGTTRGAAVGSPLPRRVVLLCGPEAGFSDAELRQASDTGWLPASLGPRVLRTETAGLAALAVLQAGWGDLR
jgi:16S rRNA (uracil1498-N3)-methyltransferase